MRIVARDGLQRLSTTKLFSITAPSAASLFICVVSASAPKRLLLRYPTASELWSSAMINRMLGRFRDDGAGNGADGTSDPQREAGGSMVAGSEGEGLARSLFLCFLSTAFRSSTSP